MASNPYVNRVDYVAGGVTHTLIDITSDTVTPSTLLQGYTAHDASGAAIVGTATGGGTGGVTQDQDGYLVLDDSGDGGGGGSSYTLIGTDEVIANTTSTTAAKITTIRFGNELYTADTFIYVKIRDKAGKRSGYFYGSDTFYLNVYAAKKASSSLTSVAPIILYSFDSNGNIKMSPTANNSVYNDATSAYGVYAQALTASYGINIYQKYNTNSGTIDGTYTVEVYFLKWPDNASPITSVGE